MGLFSEILSVNPQAAVLLNVDQMYFISLTKRLKIGITIPLVNPLFSFGQHRIRSIGMPANKS